MPGLKSLLPRVRPSGPGTDPSRLFAAPPVAIHPPSGQALRPKTFLLVEKPLRLA
jgi:hypothetical protein